MTSRKSAVRRSPAARGRVGAVLILMALALALPASAQAHGGSASVSCTGASFDFYNFLAGSNTVHYAVSVNGSVAAQGSFTLDQQSGKAGSLNVPLTIYGTATVVANAWWGPTGTVGGHTRLPSAGSLAHGTVTCAAPPPAPPTPGAPAAPPAAGTAPAATTPAAQAPASGVAGEQAVAPGSAVLGVASRCSSRTVRVTVRGRSMRTVRVTVGGRVVRTLTVAAGRRSVAVEVPYVRGAQVVRATVRFRNGRRARTLTARTRQCAQVAVQPQFTG
jgi:hypothetical protein